MVSVGDVRSSALVLAVVLGPAGAQSGCVAKVDFEDVAFACSHGACPRGLVCVDERCVAAEPASDGGAPDVAAGADAAAPEIDAFEGPCTDEDLGSQVGAPVATGSTDGVEDDHGRCGGGGSPDVTYAWRAPLAGSYRFDTCVSDFDTILVILDGVCEGPRLDCNDDAACDLGSQVTVTLAEGQPIVIVVDGYGDSGTYQLAITAL